MLHPIDSFTSGLPDGIGNSFQHHKQHRQIITRQTFSQPLSDSFFCYIFSFPLVLSMISSYSISKVCILPKFCVLEKLVTCGVTRSYNFLLFSLSSLNCLSSFAVTKPKQKRKKSTSHCLRSPILGLKKSPNIIAKTTSTAFDVVSSRMYVAPSKMKVVP